MRVLMCAMFSDSTSGIELRLGYSVDSPLHRRMVPDIESGRVLAQNWLDSVRAAANRI